MNEFKGTPDMVYVAEDPEQPGAAWAICACAKPGETKWQKEVAKTIADYARKGAIVKHVMHEVGCEMVRKWVRPVKSVPASADLFGDAS